MPSAMPLPSDPQSPEPATVYDVLDKARRWPGIYLGGLDDEWIAGTKMPRLQAFLCGLECAQLDDGTPPFSMVVHWLAVREPDISDAHNLAFHWLEQTFGPDRSFDLFFERLDEYRSCHTVDLERSNGPFAPRFTVGLTGEAPRCPDAVVVRRFAPSSVFFWEAVHAEGNAANGIFFSTQAAAKDDAGAFWGVEDATWTAAVP